MTSTQQDPQWRRALRHPVVWFIAADIVAVILIAGVGLAIARRVATQEAIRDALAVVQTDARHVAPILTDDMLGRAHVDFDTLDEVVRQRVLSEQVVRVKLWDRDGRIVYSDDKALIGEKYPLGSEEREAIEDGTSAADLSDLNKPENRDERSYGKLLEVYDGVRTRDGTPVLFEAYLRFDTVTEDGSRILSAFAPAVLGGLLALFLIQIPLALALTRRVTNAEEARRRLLQQAIESSERERTRIAADLHDSVVQGLAGSSLSLAAMAEAAERSGDLALGERLRDRAGELRQSVRELRSLIVSMVPPRLHESGLSAALTDLTASLPSRGVEATVEVDPTLDLGASTESLLFRATQEATRNIVAHAIATRATISVVAVGDNRVRLIVIDDGRGFEPGALERARAGGHVGLKLLSELVEHAGGTIDIDSRLGVGTTITVEVAQR
jgi:signal transduction histidine kinase